MHRFSGVSETDEQTASTASGIGILFDDAAVQKSLFDVVQGERVVLALAVAVTSSGSFARSR